MLCYQTRELNAFIRRYIRLSLHRQDDRTVAQLIADLDDSLFATVLANDQHVLRYIYLIVIIIHSLKPRRHELSLANKRDSRNFVERLLFKYMY